MRRTGRFGCRDSPYDLADEAFDMWIETRHDDARDEFRKHAQAEVDFLISLRTSSTCEAGEYVER